MVNNILNVLTVVIAGIYATIVVILQTNIGIGLGARIAVWQVLLPILVGLVFLSGYVSGLAPFILIGIFFVLIFGTHFIK